ncbi:unnamed protein product [Camellia sinensis]
MYLKILIEKPYHFPYTPRTSMASLHGVSNGTHSQPIYIPHHSSPKFPKPISYYHRTTTMASSSFSLTSPSSCPPITDEQFNDFHSIDRILYSRLVLGLDRDPAESMQVMALWLLLERGSYNRHLVNKILSLPGSLINSLVDETAKCLKCTEGDRFVFDGKENDIPLMQNLLGREINLRYFHENRIWVLRGVTKIVNEVCIRAFDEIMRSAFRNNSFFSVPFYHHGRFGSGTSNVALPVVVNCGGVGSEKIEGNPNQIGSGVSVHGGYDSYDQTNQGQILNNELRELFGRISILVNEEEKEVPPDDRTIFLTFSKGYPTSETEVRDFFTRKFGEIIEAIHMQEVPAEGQVLYARLVVHSASVINVVLEGQRKAKFSINGKHVWARKYVKKNPKSPSHQPTSPVAAAPKP